MGYPQCTGSRRVWLVLLARSVSGRRDGMCTRKLVLVAVLVGLLAVVVCVAAIRCGKSSGISVHLARIGPYSGDVVFEAAVTNETHQQIVLDGVRFDWEDRMGRGGFIYGFSGWAHSLKPGEFTITAACIPACSIRVRASTIDDRPKLLQRATGQIAAWTRADRSPVVSGWLLRAGLLSDGSLHQRLGPWMVNLAAAGSGAKQIPQFESSVRSVPEH